MIHPKKLCQLELYSSQHVASLKFFADVFGWTALPIRIHEFSVLEVPSDCSFGISIVSSQRAAMQDFKSYTGAVPYFAIEESLDIVVSQAEKAGARILLGPRDVPGYGQTCLIEDPGGIKIGLFQK